MGPRSVKILIVRKKALLKSDTEFEVILIDTAKSITEAKKEMVK